MEDPEGVGTNTTPLGPLNIPGRRRDDCPFGRFPGDYDDLQPGDYWFVLTKDGSRRLDVLNGPVDVVTGEPSDRSSWGVGGSYAGNLTGYVLGVSDPLGRYGMLSLHTVRLEDDGTVSVRPNDGSTNSILIRRRGDEPYWHGFIEHGNWVGAVEGP